MLKLHWSSICTRVLFSTASSDGYSSWTHARAPVHAYQKLTLSSSVASLIPYVYGLMLSPSNESHDHWLWVTYQLPAVSAIILDLFEQSRRKRKIYYRQRTLFKVKIFKCDLKSTKKLVFEKSTEIFTPCDDQQGFGTENSFLNAENGYNSPASLCFVG